MYRARRARASPSAPTNTSGARARTHSLCCCTTTRWASGAVTCSSGPRTRPHFAARSVVLQLWQFVFIQTLDDVRCTRRGQVACRRTRLQDCFTRGHAPNVGLAVIGAFLQFAQATLARVAARGRHTHSGIRLWAHADRGGHRGDRRRAAAAAKHVGAPSVALQTVSCRAARMRPPREQLISRACPKGSWHIS